MPQNIMSYRPGYNFVLCASFMCYMVNMWSLTLQSVTMVWCSVCVRHGHPREPHPSNLRQSTFLPPNQNNVHEYYLSYMTTFWSFSIYMPDWLMKMSSSRWIGQNVNLLGIDSMWKVMFSPLYRWHVKMTHMFHNKGYCLRHQYHVTWTW